MFRVVLIPIAVKQFGFSLDVFDLVNLFDEINLFR
jgi:hypothetical protein